MRLPDFLIIGGMRCGTTSLFELLRNQGAVFLPGTKELHFFDRRNPDLPDKKAYATLFERARAGQKRGEATPDYLTTPGCAVNIHALVPDARLIVVLRDPVERAWSHYQFSRFHKVETEPLDVALEAEDERLAMATDHSDIFFSYQQRGRYLEHIRLYESLFGREQIHVTLLDELVRDTRRALAQIMLFLDADFDQARTVDELPSVNRTSAYRALAKARGLTGIRNRLKSVLPDRAATLSAGDRARLSRYFKPYNRDLEDWMGRSLPWQ